MQRPHDRLDAAAAGSAGAIRAAELRTRGDALRMAVAMPDAELRPILDAALIELDAAVDALAGTEANDPADGQEQDLARLERQLLRAIFQQVPLALFLLGKDGTVRRANEAAAALFGSSEGYATGKRFTGLVDLPFRAAVQSQLAAVTRTGAPGQLSCALLGGDGMLTCELRIRRVSVRGEQDRLLVAVTLRRGKTAKISPDNPPGEPAAKPARQAESLGQADAEVPPLAGDVVATMTRRLDLVLAANRLLLENVASSEGALLQRMARLLADHLATWVLIDVKDGKHAGRLVRHSVAGPDEEDSAARAEAAMTAEPDPGSLPAQVALTGSSVVLAHADEDMVLGAAKDGVPLLVLLRGTSVLCVPIRAGDVCHGTLTMVRPSAHGVFRLADAGLAEEIAEQLARAVDARRMIERRTRAAESLQASLLPPEPKQIPGVKVGAAHLAPTQGNEVGGDFYDIYATPQGWGVAIGDVCGKGKDAAAVTAAARHAIRVLGYRNADPGEVLRAANDIMLAEAFDGRFVTADAAHLSWQDGKLKVVLGSAGHPPPVLICADGRAQLIEGGGVPLGVFPDGEAAVVERELELGIGDVLFFCTDGLIGARSPDLTYFGERLADELAELAGRAPADLISGLTARLTAFCDGILLDDVTMLALQPVQPPD